MRHSPCKTWLLLLRVTIVDMMMMIHGRWAGSFGCWCRFVLFCYFFYGGEGGGFANCLFVSRFCAFF